MLNFLKRKSGMFMCAGPAVIGFLLGLAIGFVIAIMMAKGVIPGGTFICPKVTIKP
jgi:acetyltransferase-like isoleucine patch superfamily enzyme